MVVTKTPVALSFQGGLQSKVDSLQLTPNNLIVLENGRFNIQGEIDKRPGTTELPTTILDGGTITSNKAINVYNNELLAFDGNYVYSYITTASAWVNRGTAISVINTSTNIVRNSFTQTEQDGAYCNGYECYTWQDSSGGVQYSIRESSSGAFLVSGVSVFNNGTAYNYNPKVVSDGAYQFYIFFTDGSQQLLYCRISTFTPTVLGNVSRAFQGYSVSDGSLADFVYDAIYDRNYNGMNEPIICIYASQTGTIVVFPDGSNANLGGDSAPSVTVQVDSQGLIWFLFTDNGNIHYAIYNSDYSVYNAGGKIINAVGLPQNLTMVETDAGTMMIVYDVNPESFDYPNNYVFTGLLQSTGSYTQLNQLLGFGLASKAFSYLNNQYVNVVYSSTVQGTYFTVCLNRNTITTVGKINPGEAGGYRVNRMLPNCLPYLETGQFLFATLKLGSFSIDNNVTYTPTGVASEIIDFTHTNNFNSLTSQNNLLLVGGIVQSYDGVSFVENNFHIFPENISISTQSSSGNLSAGLYQYSATYEWTDNVGNIQYSTPSIANSITNNNGDQNTLTIPTCRLTTKQGLRSAIQITIYRTQVNSPIFYRIGAVSNDTTVDTVSFVDDLSDQTIASNSPLYTQIQVFNSAPPSCSLISYFNDRVMLSGMEDPNEIWFSQSNSNLENSNVLPVQFSELLTLGVDPYGGSGNGSGDITALNWIDSTLVIFKDKTIFTLNGSGPNENGTGNNFPAANSILTDVGCSNQNSIVIVGGSDPTLFFKSDKGIYSLDRNLTSTYIGAPVEDFNDQTISSAQLLADTNEVVFTTLEGNILVFNYYFNVWSVWTNLPAVDSVIWNNSLILAQANGTILIQDSTVYTDNGRSISLKAQTPWIGIGGMQGQQIAFYAFLLGTFQSAHILNVGVSYNYNPSISETHVINSNVVNASAWGGLPIWGEGAPWGYTDYDTMYQFRINFGQKRCQAVRLTIYDSPITPYGESYTLNSLVFILGQLSVMPNLPPSNKF